MPNDSSPEKRPIPQPGATVGPSAVSAPLAPPRGRPGLLWTAVLLVLLGAAGWFAWMKHAAGNSKKAAGPSGRPGMGNYPVPVVAGTVQQKEVPVYLDGLGTVQAFNTVTIHSRVDGQILKVAFTEGQDVHVGDLLAQIDPAPFQAQLDQSIAKKAQDEAQLAIARLTLTRDKELLAGKILAQQDFDTQKAMVDQLEATVRGDDAAINNARIQLGYTTITSPLDGRAGLRMIDQGNIVHANDSNGLVSIAQLRPISVTFTLPEQSLQPIRQHLPASGSLTALALDRDNRSTLSDGKLAVIDNQIDISTGTIRLKAIFSNDDLKLWPGQFINVRLLLETRTGPVVPASVVQHGPDGDFAFVINPDLSVQVRPVKVGQIDRGQALIEQGLTPGELVVVDGQYKLNARSKVKLSEGKEPAGTSTPSTGNPTASAGGPL